MPEISRFYGIIIRMYFKSSEHNPPHIHAIYQKYIIAIAINDFRVLSGDMPPTAKKMVLEWMNIHKEELNDMWNKQEFRLIEPLK